MKTEKKQRLKGFTLVELVVVIAVFGLLIAATLSFLAPTSRIMKNTSEYAHSAAVVDNVRRVVEDNLRYANRMDVYAGPDISAGEAAFMQEKVNALRTKFLLGTNSTSTNERLTYGQDIVYVMKINNPETFQNLSSTTEKPGKISIWEYDNGALNAANSKEWAVSEAVYGDYSFSLSYGINWTTTGITVAGRQKELITSGTYQNFNGFQSPSNFRLVLDIYENEYSNKADKANSSYTLCKTSVSNVVALSFVNMATSTTIKKEDINYIDRTVPGTEIVDVIDPERYTYTSDSYSNDLYFVYTLPELT